MCAYIESLSSVTEGDVAMAASISADPNSSSRVELVASCQLLLLGVDGDDLPPRPNSRPYVASDWVEWRKRWHETLELEIVGGADGLNVAIRDIRSDRLLDAIIDFALTHIDESDSPRPLADSGITLLVNGLRVAQPMCCVDLREATKAWTDFIDVQPTEWCLIWTGHPFVMGRVIAEVAEFTQQTDSPELSAAAEAPLAGLASALVSAVGDLEEFADRLASRLATRGLSDPGKTSRIIAGLTPAQ